MRIPLVDLRAQYERYRDEIDAAMRCVVADTAFIGGRPVREFEDAFASFARSRFAVSCANGTDSMEILLSAMGIGPGDEVIVPALSWISTSEVVSTVGATPVFVDVDASATLDPDRIEERVTSRTRAIIPVHLYGCPADMPRILSVAGKHGMRVIEDCAQAHGAELQGRRVATFGDAGSFSFYPGKNLGAYGDAGAIVTDDEELADHCRRIANHGQLKKHEHLIEGRNSRMDGIQAAILTAKLEHLEQWTEERRDRAARYRLDLSEVVDALPPEREGARHVYHLFVIQIEERDALRAHLEAAGIGTGVHYPRPLPLLPCYALRGYTEGDFPVATALTRRILSLPMYPELAGEQQERIAEAIRAFDR